MGVVNKQAEGELDQGLHCCVCWWLSGGSELVAVYRAGEGEWFK